MCSFREKLKYKRRVLETGLELLCRVILLLLLLEIGYDIIHGLVPACFHPVRVILTLPLSHLTLPRGSSKSEFMSIPQKLKLKQISFI